MKANYLEIMENVKISEKTAKCLVLLKLLDEYADSVLSTLVELFGEEDANRRFRGQNGINNDFRDLRDSLEILTIKVMSESFYKSKYMSV